MIFHVPLQLNSGMISPSHIRPMKMLEAFQFIGYEVDVIEGDGGKRKESINNIKKRILSGIKYEFLYSESSTMPTLLTEKNHLPIYPCLDFSFFSFCKRYGIPIGLFYRDIYWCFPEYYTSPTRKVARWFYLHDLRKYNNLLDAVFVPSQQMLDFLPLKLTVPSYELPSGLEKSEHHKKDSNDRMINILYVGGVGMHYDLHLLMKIVSNSTTLSLTLCCRKADWESVKDNYSQYLCDNIKIVHESGKGLESLYAQADVFSIFLKPIIYRQFAVPYKLFETIGRRCPIIASNGTWVGDFVKKNQIGFVCDYDDKSLSGLLDNLTLAKIETARDNIDKIIDDNTWEARCRKVEDILTNKT